MRQNLRAIRRLVMAGIAACALLVGGQVRADTAPPPLAAASDIDPGQGTQVQMQAETVALEIQPDHTIL